MKGWQVDLILERDTLESKIKGHYGSLPYDEDNLYELCNWTERLYHMTKYIQSLDKEIASFQEKP